MQGVLGTSFYISPEIANGWASYDERADLFSLGVLAFEVFHPFSTGMERVKILGSLQADHVLPAAWAAAHPQVGPTLAVLGLRLCR